MTTAPHALLMVGLIAFYQPSCLHVDSGRRSLSVQAHGVWRLNDFRILLVTRQESKIPGTRSAFQVFFACFFLSSYHPPRILFFFPRFRLSDGLCEILRLCKGFPTSSGSRDCRQGVAFSRQPGCVCML